MKNEKEFKNFGALSFDGCAVIGETRSVSSVLETTLASEWSSTFVHPDDSAHSESPSVKPRPGPKHAGTKSSEVIARAEEYREELYRRYTAPYVPTPSYRHWGINE